EAAITAAPSSRYPGDVVLLAERVGKIRRYRAHPLGQTDQRFERAAASNESVGSGRHLQRPAMNRVEPRRGRRPDPAQKFATGSELVSVSCLPKTVSSL